MQTYSGYVLGHIPKNTTIRWYGDCMSYILKDSYSSFIKRLPYFILSPIYLDMSVPPNSHQCLLWLIFFFITTILMDLKLYLLMTLIFAFLQCQITVNIFSCAYWLCLWLLSENTYYNSSYIFLIIFLSIIKLCMLFLC